MVNGNIERPLDLLNTLKGKRVLIKIKGDKEMSGELLAFDIHINLAIKDNEDLHFIRGESIISIS